MSHPTLLSQWDRVRRSDRVAVIDQAGEHAFAAIDARAGAIAAALREGRPSLDGERVALSCAPGAAFVAAFFGVLRAGGCVVVLCPQHPRAESAYFVSDARVRTVLVTPDLAEQARALDAPSVIDVTSIERAPVPDAAPAIDALQLYTSGTTARPKGVVLTLENLGVQASLLHEAWAWSASDVLLHVLPLHHMHGLAIALLPALTAGATARMLPRFDAIAAWETMGSSTVFMAVPTIYAKLFAAWDDADEPARARWRANATKLRLATSGSAALPVTLAERWRAVAGEIPLERFGMTEIGVGLGNPLAGPRKPGSVGRPLPTVETRVVDHGGDASTGELWIRGPSVFRGYFEREQATRDAFEDGWFKTGDTVARDDDGTYRVLGRTSVDILKSGGYKLSALEIEEVLREHPAVAEVAVVGVPDETWGDRVVACVIARGAPPAPEALRAFAHERLAAYKVPKEVLVLEELPRNAVGKVVKPELVRRITAKRPAPS